MKILVTGANGQLGNAMQMLAKENPQHTYFFTDVAELDICNEEALREYFAQNGIEVAVNCAAYTAVDKAEDNANIAQALNAEAPGKMARVAQEHNAAIIHISTDYVFDGTSCIPYTEDTPVCPQSVYGRTKLAGEENVMAACRKAVVIRTAWLYSTVGNNFVKTMMRLGKERKELGVVFDQIGTPTYANDLARAIFSIINKSIVRGIYHFSNEGVCSWYDFAKEICELSGHVCDIQPCHSDEFPSKVKRPAFSVLDKSKVKAAFGICIPYWKDSLKKCIAELDQTND